jgi:hypothetical protein
MLAKWLSECLGVMPEMVICGYFLHFRKLLEGQSLIFRKGKVQSPDTNNCLC